MIVIKAGDLGCGPELAVRDLEVGVTLRAIARCDLGETHGAFVFDVARTAFGSEGLVRTVRGSRVAGHASGVTGVLNESCLPNAIDDARVTSRAIIREKRVCTGERSAADGMRVAAEARGDDPDDRNHWNDKGER